MPRKAIQQYNLKAFCPEVAKDWHPSKLGLYTKLNFEVKGSIYLGGNFGEDK